MEPLSAGVSNKLLADLTYIFSALQVLARPACCFSTHRIHLALPSSQPSVLISKSRLSSACRQSKQWRFSFDLPAPVWFRHSNPTHDFVVCSAGGKRIKLQVRASFVARGKAGHTWPESIGSAAPVLPTWEASGILFTDCLSADLGHCWPRAFQDYYDFVFPRCSGCVLLPGMRFRYGHLPANSA